MRFRDIFRIMKAKDPVKIEKPELYKSSKKMPWNIYYDKVEKDHVRKFNRIHYVWKYKFFLPLLLLGKKILGKYIVKEIPKEAHNRNLIIFDKAFERSLVDWNVYYRRMGGPDDKRKSPEWWKKQTKSGACDYLRTMKDFTITMAHNDTAYREFFNILMHNIAHDMVKEYGDKEKYPSGVGHLFYADGGPYDIHYYILFKWAEVRGNVQWRDAHEYLMNYENERRVKKSKRKMQLMSGMDNSLQGGMLPGVPTDIHGSPQLPNQDIKH